MIEDPTKVQPIDLKKFKRDVASIFIAYDPNTGQLNIESKAFLPIEELGALQWAIAVRAKSFLEPQPKGPTQ